MKHGISIATAASASNGWKSAGRCLPIIGRLVAAFVVVAGIATARAQTADAGAGMAANKLQQAGFDQKLGAQIPLDLVFTDDGGQQVKLGKYFEDGKPVLLTLNYFACPMLCTMILNGVVECTKSLSFKVGDEFKIVTVSFDPRDTAKVAAQKKANYLEAIGRKDATNGWFFLTGTKDQIDRLCGSVGFSYVFDEKSGQYGHASGIMLATPQGKLSRYFYGLDYAAKDVKFGLMDASNGRIGSPVEKLLLWCFHYDATSGKYSASINRIIQGGCVAAIAAVAAFLVVQFRREFRRQRKVAA